MHSGISAARRASALLIGVSFSMAVSLPVRAGDESQGATGEYFPAGVTKSTYMRACREHSKHLTQSDAAVAGEEPKLVCKFPSNYPADCKKAAADREVVTLMFDVASNGGVENVRLVETTNDCFVQAAANTVFYWKYEMTDAGGKNMVSEIEFEK
ncbi:hypothetical protein [Hyphococcus sp.]|uniref:hypothetical protein n=1 Tax=Hyphococcus sp. TaxID=2038636 RepID=UPI0020894FEF|nr:MAG: hypothetical protein DHS20C04_32440 [Marinicaulis sp.]